MRRYDRDGDETESSQYLRFLWSSDKTSVEDKDWLDSIFIKRNLKYSDERRIEEIYKKIMGKHKPYPGGW